MDHGSMDHGGMDMGGSGDKQCKIDVSGPVSSPHVASNTGNDRIQPLTDSRCFCIFCLDALQRQHHRKLLLHQKFLH